MYSKKFEQYLGNYKSAKSPFVGVSSNINRVIVEDIVGNLKFKRGNSI